MAHNKQTCINELRQKHWEMQEICHSGKTLEYLSLEERIAFTKLLYDMDRQIDDFENFLCSNASAGN